MSLTNPNTPVSQQDLQDFYHKILPYMGGSFEMIANKFSKGDMYSTDERMVGQWVDGKPLYQKTVDVTNVTIPEGGVAIAHNISNIGEYKVVKKAIMVMPNGVSCYTLPYFASGGTAYNAVHSVNETTFRVFSTTSWATTEYSHLYVTLEYTKSTDSPISIGSETDYSTEEKIVGTWIDGKPLYQKTISFGTLPNATTKEVAHSISNLGQVVDIRGVAYTSSGTFMPLPLMYPSNEIVNDTMIQVFSDKIIMKNLADRSVYSAYITLQYTKTTD